LLAAFFQISFPAHTLRRCQSITPFVRPCKREVGHAPDKTALRKNSVPAVAFTSDCCHWDSPSRVNQR
jgi:hypothetical protein